MHKDNQSYYDEFSEIYERDRHEGYHAFIDRLEAEFVLRYVGPETRLLEAGCGTGLILRKLAPHVRQAVGIDLSRGMVRRARARGLRVFQSRINHLPFAASSFDLVCSFKVLAHVEDIGGALRELARVLAPSGRLIAEFYNPLSLRYLIKRLKPPTPISERTSDEAVFTRYDSLARIRGCLPPDLRIEALRGVRVLTPVHQVHRLPLVGPALRFLETRAADLPGLRRLGGFLIVVAKKVAPGSPAEVH